MSSRTNPPLIIHIGYSKCMSSWLQSLFSIVPEVSYAYKTNYFALEDSNFDKGQEWYLNQFQGDGDILIESDEHLLLPITDYRECFSKASISDFEKVLRNICLYPGSVKIIVAYRNTDELIVSRYIQYIRSGGSINIKEFINRFFSNGKWKEYFDYRIYSLRSMLVNFLGDDAIFLLNMDDFRKDRAGSIDRLSKFISCDLSDWADLVPKVNVSPSYYCIILQRLINVLFVKTKKCKNRRPVSRIGYYPWKATMKLLERIDKLIFSSKRHDKFLSYSERSILQSINEGFDN